MPSKLKSKPWPSTSKMQLHTCTHYCPQNLLLQRMCACLQPSALSLFGLQISFSRRAEKTSCLSINNFLKQGFFFHFTLAAKLKHKNNITFYLFFTSFDLQLRCLLASSTFLRNTWPANAVLIRPETELGWAFYTFSFIFVFDNFIHGCGALWLLSASPSHISLLPSQHPLPILFFTFMLFCFA